MLKNHKKLFFYAKSYSTLSARSSRRQRLRYFRHCWTQSRNTPTNYGQSMLLEGRTAVRFFIKTRSTSSTQHLTIFKKKLKMTLVCGIDAFGILSKTNFRYQSTRSKSLTVMAYCSAIRTRMTLSRLQNRREKLKSDGIFVFLINKLGDHVPCGTLSKGFRI